MKKSNTTVTLLGGDIRMRRTAALLREQGYAVTDCPHGVMSGNADYILLPLPITSDGVHLNCSAEEKPRLTDLIEGIPSSARVLAGCVSERCADLFERRGILWKDYYTDEKLLRRNAYLTAEATLQLVMQNTDIAVKNMSVLIVGSGRCGRAAAKLFKRVGARVTLTSRKFKDKIKALLMGVKPAKTKNLQSLVTKADVVINTVAHPLFTERVLKNVPKSTLVIELATSAAGIDMQAAERLETQLIYAAGLPGKHLPMSAAEAICKAITKIITEESL